MIIDSHLHLWVQDSEKYPWNPIGDYIPTSDASLLRFTQIMAKNQVDQSVLVQPTPYGWDNAYILDCKRKEPQKFKAVVLVNPLSDNASETLIHLHRQGADGLRINLHLKSVSEWRTSQFFRLWETCESLNLPICLQLTQSYLDFVGELAEKYSVMIILDHLGRPDVGSGLQVNGFQKLLALKQFPNLFIKLSGLNYYSQNSAPYQDVWELLRVVKLNFKADHCLWGSDFPFIEEHWSYSDCLNVFQHSLGFSDEDKTWILSKTAQKIWWGEE